MSKQVKPLPKFKDEAAERTFWEAKGRVYRVSGVEQSPAGCFAQSEAFKQDDFSLIATTLA